MSTTIGVLILDEPQDLSAAARAALDQLPEIRLLGEAALEQADGEVKAAVVCLGSDKLADGIARVADLKKRRPDLRILMTLDALTADHFRALLDAGADAFVGHSQSPQELRAALLALAKGSACLVPPKQSPATTLERSNNIGLSPRETEVLRLLCAGFSNKEVARRLALSVRTVEVHRLNLRRKTRTGGRKDLVALAHQLGLPPLLEEELGQHGHKRPMPEGDNLARR